MTTGLAPISSGELAELWFALRNKTWRAVTGVVRASGYDQKQLADRIGMDASQFNRVITGKAANITLRTLHNIAHAANHRLTIALEPLAGLPKQNYDYEAARRERDEKSNKIARTTEGQSDAPWTRSESSSKLLEPTF